MHGYPSNFMNYNFLNKKRIRNCSLPEYKLQEVNKKPAKEELNLVNKWLLTPAAIGTAAYYLTYFIFREERKCSKKKARIGPGVVIYTGITIAALTLYLFNVLTNNGKLLDVYLPISGALMLSILYFAAVYTWVYMIDPDSFKANTGDDVFSEVVTFIYYSITTFITAGSDIVPVTNTARILVSLHVLFFEFALTMGLIFFVT